ncbi:S-adenosyl-L-methionine-dependent methyltransferase [Schizopora paradoxa]|uniref:Cytosine-specific methyltransferase n=1 Tax=Schizopora paradoxa TaxID=27342 RepID=A0A0H2SQB1_9AGAM|nr:S-adenosyl-L-methionine-dependent methyltransferase [Schizopora paradoxa]
MRPRSPSVEIPIADIYYAPSPDDIRETKELYLDGESPMTGDDLPARVLDDFIVYKLDTRQVLELMCDTESFAQGASGVISPIFVDEESGLDDDVDSSQSVISNKDSDVRVELSKILEYWWDPQLLDFHIWLRTENAWYRLENPSSSYRTQSRDLIIAHAICCTIYEASHDPSLSWDDFLEKAQSFASQDAIQYAAQSVGLSWSPLYAEDIIKNRTIIDRLLVTRPMSGTLRRSALVTELLANESIDLDSIDYGGSSDFELEEPSRPIPRRRVSNIEREVLKHEHPTFVTSTVNRVAKGLFYCSLLVAGEDPSMSNEPGGFDGVTRVCAPREHLATSVHYEDPSTITWGGSLLEYGAKRYKSVFLDGIEYSIGDHVALYHAGMEYNPPEEPWIGTIRFLFEDDDGKLAHIQWFEHGSQTVLGETASSQELFLLNECDLIPLSTILRKVSVQISIQGKGEKGIDGFDFHCSYIWDENQVAFLQIDPSATSNTQAKCTACISKLLQKDLLDPKRWPRGSDSFMAHGIEFHLHDFVYVNLASSAQLAIGQVIKFSTGSSGEEVLAKIQFYHKSDNFLKLISRSTIQFVKVSEIRGKCLVKCDNTLNLDGWIDDDDHYITNQKFVTCQICLEAQETQAFYKQQLASKPLRVMELFAGAGGLSTGFAFASTMRTDWAVEFSPSAAKTFRENHPEVTLYNQETNVLLEHTIKAQKGISAEPLKSLSDSDELLPEMPKVGEVDIIIGGPPCQSFSGSNRHRTVDDIRHTLIPNMISYVEHYRPKYFLLENVVGLLHFRLKGKQEGRRITGGIESGMVKFIMRALTELGYQVRVGVLNAACYGSPQFRRRVIFWAARLAFPLPKFPAPTHTVPSSMMKKGVTRMSSCLPGDVKIYHPQMHDHLKKDVYDAPYPPVTVKDAISDLPEFDWVNPCIMMKPDSKQKQEEIKRHRDIPEFVATTKPNGYSFVGFPKPTPYTHHPSNLYQAWCRREQGKVVTLQFTGSFSDCVVERTVMIPFERGADQSKLPSPLRSVTLSSGKKKPWDRPGTFERLDPNGFFKTAMTLMKPDTKSSAVIHPTQKRVLTLREAARAQGFPDHYQFFSVNTSKKDILDDIQRQIGNAVCVHVGRALALELQRTHLQNYAESMHVPDDKEDCASETGSIIF